MQQCMQQQSVVVVVSTNPDFPAIRPRRDASKKLYPRFFSFQYTRCLIPWQSKKFSTIEKVEEQSECQKIGHACPTLIILLKQTISYRSYLNHIETKTLNQGFRFNNPKQFPSRIILVSFDSSSRNKKCSIYFSKSSTILNFFLLNIQI